MAGEVHDDDLNLPGNYFLVDMASNINIPFKEVINLLGNDSVLEYRNSNAPISGLIQMLGRRQERVILSNGVFVNNKSFFNWYGGWLSPQFTACKTFGKSKIQKQP